MKLVYFNGRGLAETTRLLLAINNVNYEDFRYPLKIIDWDTHNMVKKEFEQDKNDGKLLGSLNKVPFLEIDGVVIPQSKSIERFVGTKYNMMGNNEIQSARIDSICEYVRDFKDMYQSVRRLPKEEKENGMKKWFSETLVNKLESLEQILCNEHDTFSVGTRLSLADIVLYSFITQFFDDKESISLTISNCSNLKNIIKYVGDLDQIQHWLKIRPDTPF
jgi:prostaglandin-H2 D-isomerase / glutathione transferase